MFVLFRTKYVLAAFAIGWFFGMWTAFSAKGCLERPPPISFQRAAFGAPHFPPAQGVPR